jgi:menaquinone-dependent protoporphyrinogen IX oxidase
MSGIATALHVGADLKTRELAEKCVKALQEAGLLTDVEKAKEILAEALHD